MASEEEVIKFLEERGEATLEEVSSALGIPKYGPSSAYAILYSLKLKNVVERRGSRWTLTARGESGIDLYGQMPAAAQAAGEAAGVSAAYVGEKLGVSPAAEGSALSRRAVEPHEVSVLKTQTILDKLFLGSDGKALGGIPISSQLIIAGPLGAGKSLLASEVAVKAAHSGHRVLYVVLDDIWRSEAKAYDLQSRIAFRSRALGLSWERISGSLIAMNPQSLGEEFLREYEEGICGQGADLAIIDSVNRFMGFSENIVADRILMDIFAINRSRGVTGIFVAHISLRGGVLSSTPAELSQILYLADGVIEVAPAEVIVRGSSLSVMGAGRLRAIKVTMCRLCGFEDKHLLFTITPSGLIREIEI